MMRESLRTIIANLGAGATHNAWAFAVCVVSSAWPPTQSRDRCNAVEASAGVGSHAGRTTSFSIEEADRGRRALQIRRVADGFTLVRVVDDIGGAVWIVPDSLIAIAVGPIYGQPGIDLVSVPSGRRVRAIAARNRIALTYPSGADFFLLCTGARLTSGRVRLQYYRFHNVELDSVWLRPPRVPLTTDTVRVPAARVR